MKRNRLIAGFGLVVVIIVIVAINSAGKDSSAFIEVPVEKTHFEVVVTTTGEIKAENSVQIKGPSNLRDTRVHNVKISDMVPEGTIVLKGDYVATLDRTDATNRLQDLENDLETTEANHKTTLLDTTMSLRSERNNLINLIYNVEEAQLKLDEAEYEPLATQRQNEHNLDKAKRTLEQSQKNYALKVAQAEAKVIRSKNNFEQQKKRRDDLIAILNEFVIYAPQDGMVIYQKEFGGKKRTVGSQINPWDPVVATLPDFTSMMSTTYVNEIDISKIKLDQPAIITVDAFPDRKFTGRVISVANVGEQLPNSDAKVFEVLLKLNETDTILRPSMTSMNSIITAEFDDVLFIPLECIHNNDSLSFVYDSRNKIKQIIEVGDANDNQAIIVQGLEEDDVVLLSVPEDGDEWKFEGWDIFENVKQKRIEEERIRNEELERLKLEEQKRREEGGKLNLEDMTPEERNVAMQKMMQERNGSSSSTSMTTRGGSGRMRR
ncbi:efflux RND transporter periplasmic adaptor subunit [Bacteroidota bacterium]